MRKVAITIIILIGALLIYSFHFKSEIIDKSVNIDQLVLEKKRRRLSIYSNEKLIKTDQVSLSQNPTSPKEKQGEKNTRRRLFHIFKKHNKWIP